MQCCARTELTPVADGTNSSRSCDGDCDASDWIQKTPNIPLASRLRALQILQRIPRHPTTRTATTDDGGPREARLVPSPKPTLNEY